MWVVQGALEVTVDSSLCPVLTVAHDQFISPQTLKEQGVTRVEKIAVSKICKALVLSNADYRNLIGVRYSE